MLYYFPEEIRHAILLRLPIKWLVVCTSVSKPWLSIIRNSSFIRSHLNRKINVDKEHGTQLLLHGGRFSATTPWWSQPKVEEVYCLHYDNREFEECRQIDFQFNRMVKPINELFRVAGSCDGLVCLADDEFCNAFNYIIWNPAIRKAVMLPWPDVTFTTHGPFEDTIGFRFDVMTNDYKVVRLVTPQHLHLQSRPTVAEVYSLATGKWKCLGSVASPCRIDRVRPYTCFGGAIHWIVHGIDADYNHPIILAFDLGSESFGKIMMPMGAGLHFYSEVYVSGDGESLALFTKPKKDDIYCVDIWLMKEYCQEDSWTKFTTLSLQGLERWLEPHPLCFRKSGEVILALRMSGSEILVSVETESQQYTKLGSSKYKYCSINYYRESLVLMDMDNAISY